MNRVTFFLTAALCASPPALNAESTDTEALNSQSPRAIAMEVLIVRTNLDTDVQRALLLSGPTGEVAARMRKLQQDDQIVVTDRVSLTTLDNGETTVQCGNTTPVIRGQTVSGRGGPPQRSYEYQDFGTLISVATQIDGHSINVRLNVEKSQLAQRGSEPQSVGETTPPAVETLTSQATVRIDNGTTVLVSGLENGATGEPLGQLVLASARILDPSTGPTDVAKGDQEELSQVRIFALRNTMAHDAAQVVEELTHGENRRIKVCVDARTNSLIMIAEEAELEVIEAILRKLDESEAWTTTETPQDAAELEPVPTTTKYDEMEEQELRDELRRLQKELIDVQSIASVANDKMRQAETSYRFASDEEKADALLRMIEADAASRAPMNQLRQARKALDAAKQAYLQRILVD